MRHPFWGDSDQPEDRSWRRRRVSQIARARSDFGSWQWRRRRVVRRLALICLTALPRIRRGRRGSETENGSDIIRQVYQVIKGLKASGLRLGYHSSNDFAGHFYNIDKTPRRWFFAIKVVLVNYHYKEKSTEGKEYYNALPTTYNTSDQHFLSGPSVEYA